MYSFGSIGMEKASTVAGCLEPDWEAQYKTANKDLAVVEYFRKSLVDFIEVIGPFSLVHNGRNCLAELLGTVTMDIMVRTKQLAVIEKRLNGGK